ncbi:hypothetical protein WN990_32035 [Kitasatospora purpeofusca]|uniref:hypothetical protein n=1 Tax=Kitasatospora purpeofusca TaxID=67352 RepID=UPI0030F03AF8
MSRSAQLRRALATAVCTAALMSGTVLLSTPAQAGTGTVAAPAAAASHRQTAPERTVTQFFTEYRDATLGQHSEGLNTFDVRKRFLTTELDDALTVWGSDHQADPVFRGQVVPNGCTWRTADTSPEGHSTVVLTQTFDDGTTSDVRYQVNLESMVIDGLTDPPAAPTQGS